MRPSQQNTFPPIEMKSKDYDGPGKMTMRRHRTMGTFIRHYRLISTMRVSYDRKRLKRILLRVFEEFISAHSHIDPLRSSSKSFFFTYKISCQFLPSDQIKGTTIECNQEILENFGKRDVTDATCRSKLHMGQIDQNEYCANLVITKLRTKHIYGIYTPWRKHHRNKKMSPFR